MAEIFQTRDELWAALEDEFLTGVPDAELQDARERMADARALIERWLERGDQVLVYRNKALDSRSLGHRQFTSASAQVEASEHPEPPNVCPLNIPVHWAYLLVGRVA